MKDVTTQDTLNCTDCEYQCEKKISMVKHFNTKHRKSLKCCHCSEMFRDNDALEDHKMKDHSKIQNLPENSNINVKCDKCSSKFTSKMALSQHMFTTHTPTRIEETGIYCNLCGEEFWTELNMIQHLKKHMEGSQTDEPFFCKLCGIGLSDRSAINQHMINHVENVLREDRDDKESRHKVVQKLSTITEKKDEEKLEAELEMEDEENEVELDDSDLYEGFDEDGNRITEDN